VLSVHRYDFVNLSIGPFVPVEDDDVHPWTAVLDSLLSSGATLTTVAAGNNGDSLYESERRIQVPADAVNAFAIGSADTVREGYARAPYSAVGPGRSPGRVKPDVLDFGGSQTEPFIVADSNLHQGVAHTQGTSFASPAALRKGAALRAHFGDRLTPLGIRALLVHSAAPDDHEKADVGWGRLPSSLDEIMVCDGNQVRVVYQGHLSPGKVLRAKVPWLKGELQGMVEMAATFVFATEVDPEDPGNYSRAGLDVTFRPHADKYVGDAIDPKSKSFFRRSDFDTEQTLRRDAQKWETTLSADLRMRGRSLHNPVFDVHYNAREHGGSARSAPNIPYALVVTVKSTKTPDLYDQVLRTYAGHLETIEPIVDLPIRVMPST
jgi:hypothetical protein